MQAISTACHGASAVLCWDSTWAEQRAKFSHAVKAPRPAFECRLIKGQRESVFAVTPTREVGKGDFVSVFLKVGILPLTLNA
jgi:hypothetical protein